MASTLIQVQIVDSFSERGERGWVDYAISDDGYVGIDLDVADATLYIRLAPVFEPGYFLIDRIGGLGNAVRWHTTPPSSAWKRVTVNLVEDEECENG